MKTQNWLECQGYLKNIIRGEFQRHGYLLQSKVLNNVERKTFENIIGEQAGMDEYARGVKQLSEYLSGFYQKKVILLIDEYDTPIQAGYVKGYYDEIVAFMRNFLSGGLKDNPHLEKGVLTGIMRVAKESIFSGLNNLGVFTLLREEFSTCFGFTEKEVEKMLIDFGRKNRFAEVQVWYNGYIIGKNVIYNPWSIINYLNSKDGVLRPYWLNTSDNAVVEQLLTRGGKELKKELESLISGDSIEKPIEENIVFGEIEQREDLLWSFLLFGGYLKYLSWRRDDDAEKEYYELAVPNREVRRIFVGLVERWFTNKFDYEKLETMLQALRDGDIPLFEYLFQDMVVKIFSYHDFGDESEKVYRAFVTGLLVWFGGDYEMKSNRESGYGRYDLLIIPKNKDRIGYVIEFKKMSVWKKETPEQAIENAFLQIEEQCYETESVQRGIKNYKKLAIIFEGKRVWVKERGNDTTATKI